MARLDVTLLPRSVHRHTGPPLLRSRHDLTRLRPRLDMAHRGDRRTPPRAPPAHLIMRLPAVGGCAVSVTTAIDLVVARGHGAMLCRRRTHQPGTEAEHRTARRDRPRRLARRAAARTGRQRYGRPGGVPSRSRSTRAAFRPRRRAAPPRRRSRDCAGRSGAVRWWDPGAGAAGAGQLLMRPGRARTLN